MRLQPSEQTKTGDWKTCLVISFVWLMLTPSTMGIVANDDFINISPGQPVVISVLANDQAASTNQLAILRVSAPAHGTVTLNADGADTNWELSRLFQYAGVQLSNTVLQVGDANQYPRSTLTDGTWITHPVGIYNWVSGFFPGSLWYLYEQTGDAHYRGWAESWMAGISPMQYATEVDDVGFMINPSFGAGYRLTGNPDWRAVLLQTARSFSTRYNAAAGVLSTWNAVTDVPFEVFVDTMMNLEVLFRAFDLGGDPDFYTFAYNHAERTMFNHVRPDGSTYHIVRYDGNTGAVLFKGTFAGASDESTWARGQAWAIYGFAMAYRETGDLRFLNTAQRLADYYLANVPADGVPYWDFQAPGIPNAPRDSSAAAITLSALVELSRLASNTQDSARYWLAGRHLLDSLESANYLAQGAPSSGILLHGVGEPPQFASPEVDVSLIYGDYYFIEALRRYTDTYRRTRLTYQPAPGFSGTDSFVYQACDSAGNCATATVTVAVEATIPGSFYLTIDLVQPEGHPTISFPTIFGQQYQVEWVDDLEPMNTWRLLATNLVGSGSLLSVSDLDPAHQRFYRVAMQPPTVPQPNITLQAASGFISSPFILTNGYIYQPIQTTVVSNAGRAAYNFTISKAGDFVIGATVDAPGDGANSFFVNIDAEPQAPTMIWDVFPLTMGLEQRVVSWRGNGTDTANQFVPKVFNLNQGTHQLIIRGREVNARLLDMTIQPYP